MSITIRKVKWMTADFRPVPMPSTKCPIVKIYGSDDVVTAVMGIMHCNACAYVQQIHVDYNAETGEVHCAAPK